MSDFWVFGYGSLMWRPGFPHLEAVPARLAGLHRALCVYSWVHRGTREKPGLVLGLDRGGSCRGMAFRVAGEKRDEVVVYLRERELVTSVYHEVERTIRLDRPPGGSVKAITYVVDRAHEQYAGKLAPEALLAHVRGRVGQSGANPEYVVNTVRHMRSLGLKDAALEWLADRLVEDVRQQA
jgi:glutathione-specific gamma-glutamylcyclotransferase